MAGTLSVTNIQGLATSGTPTVVEVSSGHELHTNTLKGTTTAGSVTVQSEGTPSLVLQQVIAKIWRKFQNDASSYDSFGISSGTDNSTGNYTHTFSSNMSALHYSNTLGNNTSGNYIITVNGTATSSVTTKSMSDSTATHDDDGALTIHGDLA